MNIFVTDSCPVKSAQYLDNKRKVKMALESTQMLATALNVHGITTGYKTAHLNHPCSIWARQSKQNWIWLWEHAVALCSEYKRIYNKDHACMKMLHSMIGNEKILPDIGLTAFVNCARSKERGVDFTDQRDVYLAYQLYLSSRWETDKREPEWN
jgi:hypothetical protein